MSTNSVYFDVRQNHAKYLWYTFTFTRAFSYQLLSKFAN